MKKILQAIGAMLMNLGDNPEVSENVLNQILQDPARAGKEFLKFLRNGARVVISEIKKILIDRLKPFDPEKFIGEGWKIDEEDKHSLAITELDLTKVEFVDMLKEGESSVGGEEKQKRLVKAGHIRLDAKMFQTLWENQELIPASWKEPIGGNTRYIFFDGTVLRSPSGSRCVLYLYWRGGRWYWFYDWLADDFHSDRPSVVLAS